MAESGRLLVLGRPKGNSAGIGKAGVRQDTTHGRRASMCDALDAKRRRKEFTVPSSVVFDLLGVTGTLRVHGCGSATRKALLYGDAPREQARANCKEIVESARATNYGIGMEPEVLRLFENLSGFNLNLFYKYAALFERNPERPYMGASTDAFLFGPKGQPAHLYEVKSVYRQLEDPQHHAINGHHLEARWFLQCLMQLYCHPHASAVDCVALTNGTQKGGVSIWRIVRDCEAMPALFHAFEPEFDKFAAYATDPARPPAALRVRHDKAHPIEAALKLARSKCVYKLAANEKTGTVVFMRNKPLKEEYAWIDEISYDQTTGTVSAHKRNKPTEVYQNRGKRALSALKGDFGYPGDEYYARLNLSTEKIRAALKPGSQNCCSL